jgi:predicted  nucleic acid-binding Zn-ribbon protein
MPWTDALLRFQEIDLELQRLNQRLTEIKAILHDTAALTDAQRNAEQAAQTAHAAQKAQKDVEFELQRTQTELQQTEQKLYSGSVTNPRQLEDLQAKSQSLRKWVAKLEDDLLEAMVAREEADEVDVKARAHLKHGTTKRTNLEQNLTAERAVLQTRGQTLLQEAETIKARIPQAIIDSYHYLTSRTGGIPVARLNGEICSMCGVEVLKPTQRKVKTGEEAYCDGCRRLLVA